MTGQIVVCYGTPDDPAAFDEHYRNIHVPLAGRIPGLSGFTWGKCSSLDGTDPVFYAVAQLRFDTEPDMQAALASAEMKAAGRDVADFATGGVQMYVQHIESPDR